MEKILRNCEDSTDSAVSYERNECMQFQVRGDVGPSVCSFLRFMIFIYTIKISLSRLKRGISHIPLQYQNTAIPPKNIVNIASRRELKSRHLAKNKDKSRYPAEKIGQSRHPANPVRGPNGHRGRGPFSVFRCYSFTAVFLKPIKGFFEYLASNQPIISQITD